MQNRHTPLAHPVKGVLSLVHACCVRKSTARWGLTNTALRLSRRHLAGSIKEIRSTEGAPRRHTTRQAVLGVHHGGGVIAVLPERTLAAFSVVVVLGATPCDPLHAAGNLSLPLITHQQINRVRGDDAVQNTKSETSLGLKKPAQPTLTVFGELEQKVFPVAPVGDVPDMMWQKNPMRVGHRVGSLKRSCPPRKAASKLQYRAYFHSLGFAFNWLC